MPDAIVIASDADVRRAVTAPVTAQAFHVAAALAQMKKTKPPAGDMYSRDKLLPLIRALALSAEPIPMTGLCALAGHCAPSTLVRKLRLTVQAMSRGGVLLKKSARGYLLVRRSPSAP
jgi:hypothetical protein